MVKKYIYEIEKDTAGIDFEYTVYNYEDLEIVYCAVMIHQSLTDDSIYKITDKHFLNEECEFLIYTTKHYTEPEILKTKKPDWVFKGTAEALHKELIDRWKKQKNDK